MPPSRSPARTGATPVTTCVLARRARVRPGAVGVLALALLAAGCVSEPLPAGPPPPPSFAAPDAFTVTGPGGPRTAHDEGALFAHCASLPGGAQDREHHNLVVMFDGRLLLPWAPEDGGGGVSFFDVSDPCAPTLVGEGYSDLMRESHTLGFSRVDGRDYLAVDYHGGLATRGGGGDDDTVDGEVLGGVGFWDITDPTAPVWVSELDLPGYHYPDSYTRLTLSVFWQGPYVYVSGAGNGVYIVDASNPLAPVLVDQVRFEPSLLVGSMHVVGNLAMVSTAGGTRTLLLDVSDPLDLRPIPGGEFNVGDGQGRTRAYYFANVGGHYGMFARKDAGGGPILYDLSDPGRPRFAGDAHTPDGSGGYVFRHEQYVFVGDSNFGSVWDFTEERAPIEVGRMSLAGDLDTVVPVGNVAVISVDDGADPGQATVVVPWRREPDARGPVVDLHSPRDGDTFAALTSRVGLSFDEMIEPRSAHAGSVRVWDADRGVAVSGSFNVQESIVNFTPDAPLEADTTYVVAVPAGGVTDISGNPTSSELSFRFATGAAVRPE